MPYGNDADDRPFSERVNAYWDGLIVSVDTRDEGWFSWSPCESCGSHLGGHRYPVSWFAMHDHGETGTGTVCATCAMYIANGEVPDDDD